MKFCDIQDSFPHLPHISSDAVPQRRGGQRPLFCETDEGAAVVFAAVCSKERKDSGIAGDLLRKAKFLKPVSDGGMEPVEDAGNIRQVVYPGVFAAVMLQLVKEHMANLLGGICMAKADRDEDSRAEKSGDDGGFKTRRQVDGDSSFYAEIVKAVVKEPKDLALFQDAGTFFQPPKADKGEEKKSSRDCHPDGPDKEQEKGEDGFPDIYRHGKIFDAAKGFRCLGGRGLTA